MYFQVTGSGRDAGGSPARTVRVIPGSAAVMDPLASAVDPVPLDSPETVPATVSNGKRSIHQLSCFLLVFTGICLCTVGASRYVNPQRHQVGREPMPLPTHTPLSPALPPSCQVGADPPRFPYPHPRRTSQEGAQPSAYPPARAGPEWSVREREE